jgi:hypothetical protein
LQALIAGPEALLQPNKSAACPESYRHDNTKGLIGATRKALPETGSSWPGISRPVKLPLRGLSRYPDRGLGPSLQWWQAARSAQSIATNHAGGRSHDLPRPDERGLGLRGACSFGRAVTPPTCASRAGSGTGGFSRPKSDSRYRIRPCARPRPGKLLPPRPVPRFLRAARG